MNASNRNLVEQVARAIHEAKIKLCWGWKGDLNREPWERANAASPNQPWHDIAEAQAKAALAASHSDELAMALREVVRLYDMRVGISPNEVAKWDSDIRIHMDKVRDLIAALDGSK